MMCKGSIPGQSMRDLWWTKWHKDRSFSQHIGFPLSVSFHRRTPLCLTISATHRQHRHASQFTPSCEQARHLTKTKESSKRRQHTNAKYCGNLFEQRLISAGCDDNSGVPTWTHEEGSTVRARNSACRSEQHQQHQQHQQPFPVPQSM